MSGIYGAPLSALAQALDDLIGDENLDEDALQEASEGLLPALADALHGRGAYNVAVKCVKCGATRASQPTRRFTISKTFVFAGGSPPEHTCETCIAEHSKP